METPGLLIPLQPLAGERSGEQSLQVRLSARDHFDQCFDRSIIVD